MYESVIKNFKFFKRNDNSEFILQVINSFIPIKSKRNNFLVYEGEMLEEMIFIKDGRISLEAAINLEDPSKSIDNYFYEKFKDFNSEKEKQLNESPKNNNKYKNGLKMTSEITYDKAKQKINKALQAVNNQLTDEQNILNLSNNKKEDIYKFDINGGVIKNEKGDYQYLKILDIRKNEHYGIVFMSLNRPSPLSLKVRSKFAELFLLKREEAINISKSYSNIWKKLYFK